MIISYYVHVCLTKLPPFSKIVTVRYFTIHQNQAYSRVNNDNAQRGVHILDNNKLAMTKQRWKNMKQGDWLTPETAATRSPRCSLEEASGFQTFVRKLSDGLSPFKKRPPESVLWCPANLALPILLPLLLPLLLEENEVRCCWYVREVVARSSGCTLLSHRVLERGGE